MLRAATSNEWFTLFIVLGLILVSVSKYLFEVRFKDFMAVVGNSKYLKIYSRDQKFFDLFDALMFLNTALTFSIFIYFGYTKVFGSRTFDFELFIKLLFGFGTFIVIKTLIERLIGSLFEIDGIIDPYLFQKTSYLNFSGLVLLPINTLLIFTLNPSKSIIYTAIILIVLINFIGFITSFKNHQKTVSSNLFYFILYLCTLEIGPYLILYKLIIEPNA